MTADECPWLERKHTIFGKIDGNTIFNLIKISELSTDLETQRPDTEPIPCILSAVVTSNPFDDIVTRPLIRTQEEKLEPAVKEVSKKIIRNKNLISFQDDEYDDEVPVKRIKSSVENQKRIVSESQLQEIK